MFNKFDKQHTNLDNGARTSQLTLEEELNIQLELIDNYEVVV
jgi:hypothetical protein